MDCKIIQSKLVDYLTDNINTSEKEMVNIHLDKCGNCNKGYLQLKQTINIIESKPDSFSSELFKNKMHKMIIEETNMEKAGLYSITLSFRRIAASILLLICGGILGFIFNSNIYMQKEISSLKNEINYLKRNETMAVLKEQSVSEKLQAISCFSKQKKIDNNLNNTLYICLVTDENPNVRLAALKYLTNYRHIDDVKLMLIESLEYQTDPIVQVFLINVLISLEQEEAIKAIQSLISSENINPEIREYSQKILLTTSI